MPMIWHGAPATEKCTIQAYIAGDGTMSLHLDTAAVRSQ